MGVNRANGDVDAIETPIGFLPKYEDLKKLFAGIDKEYSEDLYTKHFSFYIDNIISRIDLQKEAYSKDINVPDRIFEIYDAQKKELEALKEKHGSIVTPDKLG